MIRRSVSTWHMDNEVDVNDSVNSDDDDDDWDLFD